MKKTWGWLRYIVLAVVFIAFMAVVAEFFHLIPSKDEGTLEFERLADLQTLLEPLHQVQGKPKAGEWLASQNEPGQSFRSYLRGRPILPTGERQKIYVLPLGQFSVQELQLVKTTADFMEIYFGLPVQIMPEEPNPDIPDSAQRINSGEGQQQWYAPYILNNILKPRLPDDAVSLIAFTAIDLYPDPDWNFVFGQASIVDRVGAWSIWRYGDINASDSNYKLALMRAMKVGTHETGHMFGILHCTAYECNMQGSMSMEETDKHPIWLCPECLPKILFATKVDAKERFQKLLQFMEQNKFEPERDFYQQSLKVMIE